MTRTLPASRPRASRRPGRAWFSIGVGLVVVGFGLFLFSEAFPAGLLLLLLGVILLFGWALAGTPGRGSETAGAGAPGSAIGSRDLVHRVAELWSRDPKGMAIDLLRVGVGFVWALNLLFVVNPTNQFFLTFQNVALSFAPTSLGGPGVADFVAAHSVAFAWITAALTAYLTVAFVFGITTRLACLVGGAASIVFLLTQFLSTFEMPGGTDVGPHPLYLLVYLVLYTGAAGRYFAVDHWVWVSGRARFPRLSRWVAAPRP